MKYIENYTWAHVDMEFLFECLTRYLTRSLRSLVRCHEKRNPLIYMQPCVILFII